MKKISNNIIGYLLALFLISMLTGCATSPYQPTVGMSLSQATKLSESTNNGDLVKVATYRDFVIYETWSQDYDKKIRRGRIDPNSQGYFFFRNNQLFAMYSNQEYQSKRDEIQRLGSQLERMRAIDSSVYKTIRNKYDSKDPLGDEIKSLNESIAYANKQIEKSRRQSNLPAWNRQSSEINKSKTSVNKDFRYQLIEN